MTNATTTDETRAADIARATETLNRLDSGALGPILVLVTTAYEVQEATKENIFKRLMSGESEPR